MDLLTDRPAYSASPVDVTCPNSQRNRCLCCVHTRGSTAAVNGACFNRERVHVVSVALQRLVALVSLVQHEGTQAHVLHKHLQQLQVQVSLSTCKQSIVCVSIHEY